MAARPRRLSKITSAKPRAAVKSHVIVPGSKRPPDPDAIRTGPVDPKERFDVTLILNGPKLPSADEEERLAPQDLLANYGASQTDADTVTKSLRRYGLKVDSVSLLTRSMKVSGTAKAMETAFKADLSMMRSAKQGAFRGREGTYAVPAELKGIVKAVMGLDERRMARRKLNSRRCLLPISKVATTFRPVIVAAKRSLSPSLAAVISRMMSPHIVRSSIVRFRQSILSRSTRLLTPWRRSSRFRCGRSATNWMRAGR
jgi:hypothetical protein